MMAWVYLLIAGLFEIGWPLGFKLAQTTGSFFHWILFFGCRDDAQRYFSLSGSARNTDRQGLCRLDGDRRSRNLCYRVLMFQDAVSIAAMTGLIFIISGVVLLKTA